MNYILAILGLGAIIIVHEFGHFIMAKINNVQVKSFSIGFGPKIISHKGKETEYSISLLPVGGYVEMYGMADGLEEGEQEGLEDVPEERRYTSKSPLQRLGITIAGPFMNIVLAICLFSTIYMNFGFADTSLGEIAENSAAVEAGLEVGDNIIRINGDKIFTADDISFAVSELQGSTFSLEYERNGEIYETEVTPKYNEEEEGYKIGVVFNAITNPTFVQSFKHSLNETATLITENYKAITKLVKGQGDFKTDVGGPVAIVKISSGAAKAGIWSLVKLVAFMSIGVGIFNLLPLPVLDGGTSLLLIIELITRRKVPAKITNVLNTIGVVFLFGLMLIVTIKDILFPIG